MISLAAQNVKIPFQCIQVSYEYVKHILNPSSPRPGFLDGVPWISFSPNSHLSTSTSRRACLERDAAAGDGEVGADVPRVAHYCQHISYRSPGYKEEGTGDRDTHG